MTSSTSASSTRRSRVLIFVNKIQTISQLLSLVQRNCGAVYACAALHGSMKQTERLTGGWCECSCHV
jgi:superfamily II DNA/RNA helicase